MALPFHNHEKNLSRKHASVSLSFIADYIIIFNKLDHSFYMRIFDDIILDTMFPRRQRLSLAVAQSSSIQWFTRVTRNILHFIVCSYSRFSSGCNFRHWARSKHFAGIFIITANSHSPTKRRYTKFVLSHDYDSFHDIKNLKWFTSVMNMTQLHSAIKLNIRNHNDSNFCVGKISNCKIFYIIKIQIKFAFK